MSMRDKVFESKEDCEKYCECLNNNENNYE